MTFRTKRRLLEVTALGLFLPIVSWSRDGGDDVAVAIAAALASATLLLLRGRIMRCPTCRKSVYAKEIGSRRSPRSVPWLSRERVCSRCGTDLR